MTELTAELSAPPRTVKTEGPKGKVTPPAAPLRILHVLRAPLGGLFRHVVDLTRAQVAEGHQVGIVADAIIGGANAAATLAALEPILALGLSRVPMRRLPHPSDVAAFAHVVRRIAETRPHVVHGHGSKGGLYARLSSLASAAAAPVRGYTPHGGSFNFRPGTLSHRCFMAVERLLARRTDVLLFESAYVAGRFDAHVGNVRALRRIVPNGLGAGEFVPLSPALDAAEFVYVGELRAAKGIDTLLEALVLVGRRRSPAPRLLLIGTGPDTRALQRQAAELGLSEQVSFPGPMPARAAFSRGRVLVVPSRAESLPYIVLEAAAARMPLVATNVGGIPEIFGPFADRLIACNDPEALARAMDETLGRDPAEGRAFADALARHVEGRFSIDEMVKAVMEGYRAALAAKGAIASSVSILR